MSLEPTKKLTELDHLVSILLSTLDERTFFSEFGRFLMKQVKCDVLEILLVRDDLSCIVISRNGEIVEDGEIFEKGIGPAGNVVRTKRPYFSNNVQRDPIFAQVSRQGIVSEFCMPLSVEGVVIGTVHFQGKNDGIQYGRETATEIQKILNEVESPLKNMKMYLTAKYLNDSLRKKIEEKEKELAKKNSPLSLSHNFHIEEKKIIAKSDVMKNLLEIADRVAISDVNVLMEGQSGTGKALLARRIHCRSMAKNAPFLSIDCSSLSDEQLEVALFGLETGDVVRGQKVKVGHLESSNGGTLFINNIDRLSVSLQSKLVNFIKEGLAFRVGGQIPYRSTIRIITSSIKNLKDAVSEGTFREDLFYGLSTVVLKTPPLKERRDDIEVLAHYFLNINKRVEDQKSLSPGSIKALLEYSWPGNVRELQSVMERAFILSPGRIVERDHLSENVVVAGYIEEDVEKTIQREYIEMTLDELERKHICDTLDHLSGNKTRTAKTLGITVKTLYNKLHSYGMIGQREA